MSVVSPQPASRAPRAIAPWWHTALLVGFFLCLTAAGAVFQSAAPSHPQAAKGHPPVLYIYLSMLAGEWALVLYVWRGGLRRSGTTLRALIGGRWGSAGDVARDVALAAGLWVAWHLVEMGWGRLLGSGHAAPIEDYLPRRAVECLLWVLLSLSAGFCEELVYRGYLQRQFEAWTRRPWIAVVLQAAIFGVSHGYQGAMACAKIALFGLFFGLLAMWRGSLRPGMIAHAATDLIGGIFRV
jgi:membrane protease YdiL (CAAX protease family)